MCARHEHVAYLQVPRFAAAGRVRGASASRATSQQQQMQRVRREAATLNVFDGMPC